MNRSPQTKRVAPLSRTIALSILAGVTLTFVTSWLPLLYLNHAKQGLGKAPPPPVESVTWWPDVWKATAPGLRTHHWLAWGRSVELNNRERAFVAARLMTGWPLPALESWSGTSFDASPNVGTGVMPPETIDFGPLANGLFNIHDTNPWGASVGADFPQHRFPIKPHWPGFLINTLIYALIIWLCTRPWRRLRAARGLCPHCAYDVRGLTTCPECGGPTLPPPHPTTATTPTGSTPIAGGEAKRNPRNASDKDPDPGGVVE